MVKGSPPCPRPKAPTNTGSFVLQHIIFGVKSLWFSLCMPASAHPPTPIVQPRDGAILCASSLVALPCVVCSACAGSNVLCALAAAQLVLSINFWRQPRWDLNRTADIGCAIFSATISCYYAFGTRRCTVVYFSFALSIVCFINACRLWAMRNPAWVWWHVGVHATCSVGNILLYDSLAQRQ